MHKNRFPALRYANNDRHKRCLIVSKGAFLRLTCVASGSVVKRSLNMNNEEKKKRKHGRLVEQIADDMKRIADGTKQNKKRQKVYALSSLFLFCIAVLGILQKDEIRFQLQNEFLWHLKHLHAECISPVHIVSLHRLEFILSKRFQCTKTGFQRCAMQITIAIKALRYANNDRHKRCLIVSKGALVRLTYVASGSFLSTFTT
ncbi:hypothetical protein T05_12881 [Trichinella murrelli]|uniref:Uncharacterized protein n=3 Tax=Trichinella TaxID=6333 RepID=A0A0V0TLT7_9BILA|nr:hypothetical protein T05_12881 [Trichinella murrelli]